MKYFKIIITIVLLITTSPNMSSQNLNKTLKEVEKALEEVKIQRKKPRVAVPYLGTLLEIRNQDIILIVKGSQKKICVAPKASEISIEVGKTKYTIFIQEPSFKMSGEKNRKGLIEYDESTRKGLMYDTRFQIIIL